MSTLEALLERNNDLLRGILQELRRSNADAGVSPACPSCGDAEHVLNTSVCGAPPAQSCGACGVTWRTDG